MKIVFFGTSEFAVASLEAILASGHDVACVVTRPDKGKGRSLRISAPPVKEIALKNKIDILQPEKLDGGFIKKLKIFEADLFCVISFGHILKKEILEIPKIYSINLHASLLPKYRGAAPINRAIMNGESVTGVTIIKMNEKMDEGDIVSRMELEIKRDDTALSLSGKIALLGAELVLETIDMIEKKQDKPVRQPEDNVSYADKLTKQDGLINWQEEARVICNKIRGLIPWPGAYTYYKGKILKLWKAEALMNESGSPGAVIKAEGGDLIIAAGKEAIKVIELQLEAGNKMDAASFLRGHRLKPGEALC